MPYVAFLSLFIAFWRDLWKLFQDARYRSVLLWMGILLAVGVSFYRVVEGWSFVDALYFCVIALATVGFGDLTPTTPASKLFTVAYVIMGLSLFIGFANLLTRDRRRLLELEDGQGKDA
jgi:voltage-gated potassium channel